MERAGGHTRRPFTRLDSAAAVLENGVPVTLKRLHLLTRLKRKHILNPHRSQYHCLGEVSRLTAVR